MSRLPQHRFIFHPITVLVASLFAATIFAILITLLFDGDVRWFLLYYFAPIAIPFVAFLFGRAEYYEQNSMVAWVIDVVVLIPALTRAFIRLPWVSGHALFLTYSLLASRSKVARVTAALVLVQVVYLKLFITHDTALFGGIIAGSLTAFLYRRVQPITGKIQMKGDL